MQSLNKNSESGSTAPEHAFEKLGQINIRTNMASLKLRRHLYHCLIYLLFSSKCSAKIFICRYSYLHVIDTFNKLKIIS